MSYLNHLKKVQLFNGITESEFAVLSSIFHEKHYSKDKVIFEEGSPGDELYIILEGEIGINIHGDDEKKRLQIAKVEQDDVVGEFSLIDDSNRSASAICLTDVMLLSFTKDDFYRLVELHKGIGFTVMKNLGKILCARLRDTNLRLKDSILFFSVGSQ